MEMLLGQRVLNTVHFICFYYCCDLLTIMKKYLLLGAASEHACKIQHWIEIEALLGHNTSKTLTFTARPILRLWLEYWMLLNWKCTEQKAFSVEDYRQASQNVRHNIFNWWYM